MISPYIQPLPTLEASNFRCTKLLAYITLLLVEPHAFMTVKEFSLVAFLDLEDAFITENLNSIEDSPVENIRESFSLEAEL